MLKVPCRRRPLPHAVDVKLTTSRVFDGVVEVTISTPGRSGVDRPEGSREVAGRGAKSASSTRAKAKPTKRP